MKVLKYMLVACGLLLACAANAESSTDFLLENKAVAGQVKSNQLAMSSSRTFKVVMSLSGGDMMFTLDGDGNTNPKNCQHGSFILPAEHSSYDAHKQLLLMAYSLDKPVTLYAFECHSSGHNLLAYIYTSWRI